MHITKINLKQRGTNLALAWSADMFVYKRWVAPSIVNNDRPDFPQAMKWKRLSAQTIDWVRQRLEKFGQHGALLTHAISQHHYRDMHCAKWSRAHQSPNNLFSCPETGLKFAYFVIKFFQLFFTVRIALSEGQLNLHRNKRKEKQSNRTTARFLSSFVPFWASHARR